MAKSRNFLAFDLGAESGRAVIGRLSGGRITLEAVHRFPNIPVRVNDGLHWDVLRLFQEMKDGLRIAARDAELASAGLDTWGVDFALLDRAGSLIANPFHYRDNRTDGIMEEVFSIVPREEVFAQTGIQFMQLNTVFQMYALKKGSPHVLDAAKTILMIPDLFNYWFSGEAACEYTEATTSQMFNPVQGHWAKELNEKLGLPYERFAPIVQPGTLLGNMTAEVADDCGVGRIPLIAPATHDTGSAVAAVPAESSDFAYISSGTWSLVGVEAKAPVITDKSLEYNFTNEGGVAGTIRLLKNVMGLWIVQECRRTWEKKGVTYDYATLTEMASNAAPFASLINPDDPVFFQPGDMPSRIQQYCKNSGQKVPGEPGEIVRVALDSLSLKYRWVVEKLEELTGKCLPIIHAVGGGIQNRLLSQLTADSTGRTVICGPVEATALGNIIVQAIGMGDISSIAEGRAIIRNSQDLETYQPKTQFSQAVQDAYDKFVRLLG